LTLSFASRRSENLFFRHPAFEVSKCRSRDLAFSRLRASAVSLPTSCDPMSRGRDVPMSRVPSMTYESLIKEKCRDLKLSVLATSLLNRSAFPGYLSKALRLGYARVLRISPRSSFSVIFLPAMVTVTDHTLFKQPCDCTIPDSTRLHPAELLNWLEEQLKLIIHAPSSLPFHIIR
jgi:hypothetical protein